MFYYLALIGIAGTLVWASLRKVPSVHYGIVERLGRRTGRVLLEGLRMVAPFIETVRLYEVKLDSKSIKLAFFSKDNLEVMVQALVQWRPDWRIRNPEGRNKFMENKEETIITGITDAIKSVVGNIIGQVKAEVFIRHKAAVERYIDCVLRLPRPPHVNPSLIDPAFEAAEIVGAKARIDFYGGYAEKIGCLLRTEAGKPEEVSELEDRYGIDIVAFDMADVDFSLATKGALEKKKQTEEKLKSDDLEAKKKIEMIEKLKALGVEPQSALNSAEVNLDQAEKKIFSLEGLDKFSIYGQN